MNSLYTIHFHFPCIKKIVCPFVWRHTIRWECLLWRCFLWKEFHNYDNPGIPGIHPPDPPSILAI